jgi:putative nucleotidyltransferase with HDIG domain
MSNGAKRRSRLDRVSALEMPPGRFLWLLRQLRRREVVWRIAFAVVAAVAMWAVNAAWYPPFRYHLGDVPNRDLLASVMFKEPNPAATEDARLKAREEARFVYAQNAEPLVQLRAALRNSVVALLSATTFENVDKALWQQFQPPSTDATMPPLREQEEEQFEQFRAALASDRELVKFQNSLSSAMASFERRGLLEKLPPEHDKGNHEEILVHPVKDPREQEIVRIEDVLIGAVSVENGPLQQRLAQHFDNKDVAQRVFNWLRPKLVPTLKLDPAGSERAREEAAAKVDEEYTVYNQGHLLAKANVPLGNDELRLLRMEYDAQMGEYPVSRAFYRSLGMVLLVLVMFVPSGVFIFHVLPQLLQSFQRYATLLLLLVVTAGLARWLSEDTWRAEVIPLLLFGMTIAIAYSRALAVILSSVVAVLLVLSIGQGVGSLIILIGVVVSSVLMLSNIRSRSKLIKIGCFSAIVAFLLTAMMGLIDGRPLELPIVTRLLTHAGTTALWTLLVGFLITGLLPFIERLFGVLTDISLLELGDAAHPLLQELVRRAPGTYNHSINVASLAEPAAESIGARGLLVRVGAYFHDIGKMLKPAYFVENQGTQASRHESLLPAMSTLIIIAHIKDGADLARQHHLPQPIIDFIEQHHGTTLVEYFFRRASEQSEATGHEVEENAFRYPGPKPQTREAAVLMLADAVESASRVLVEPTPSRIRDLVDEIAMKRLLDGQFDECDMTLLDIRTVQESLIKSLIAVYHGRVKYPDQKTA